MWESAKCRALIEKGRMLHDRETKSGRWKAEFVRGQEAFVSRIEEERILWARRGSLKTIACCEASGPERGAEMRGARIIVSGAEACQKRPPDHTH